MSLKAWNTLARIQDHCVSWIAVLALWWLNYRKQRYIYILTTIPHHTSVKLVYLWIILYWNVWLKKLLFEFLTWVSYKEITNEFWLETRAEFPIIAETDLNLHLSFCAVYLHEAVSSAFIYRKSSSLSIKGIPLLEPLPLLRMHCHFFKEYF